MGSLPVMVLEMSMPPFQGLMTASLTTTPLRPGAAWNRRDSDKEDIFTEKQKQKGK
jgi:hypothetical protein